MAESTTAEDIVMALGIALVRKGVLDADDLNRAAADAEREGLDAAAHALRLILIEGQAVAPSEWTAQQLRSQMRLVADGGNNTGD